MYPLMPLVARLHATGERARIQQVLTRSARTIFLFSSVLALGLIIFSAPVLSLFGGDFTGGVEAFRILAAGELVKVFLGFGGLALVMTGHERGLAKGVAVWAGLNIGIGAALIPWLGVDGAAIASTASAAVANLYLVLLAWRRVGIYAPVLRIFPRRRTV
jgi:O-antigen/teichoic acid export membrane protein